MDVKTSPLHTPLVNISGLDIHSDDEVSLGDEECVPPVDPGPSGQQLLTLSQHLECNTKLWWEKQREDEEKKKQGDWFTSASITTADYKSLCDSFPSACHNDLDYPDYEFDGDLNYIGRTKESSGSRKLWLLDSGVTNHLTPY